MAPPVAVFRPPGGPVRAIIAGSPPLAYVGPDRRGWTGWNPLPRFGAMAANPNPYAYLQPFAVWENAFTPAELDTVVALGDALPLQKAGVVYTPGQSEDDAGQRV